MPKTMDEAVALLLGNAHLQIAAGQVQLAQMQEQHAMQVAQLRDENQKLQKDLNDMLTKPPAEKESV